MKRILLIASAIAGMFLTAACQQELYEPETNGTVTYEITLPAQMQTKASHEYAEYDLYYEVYKTVSETELANNDLQPLFEDSVVMTGNTHTLNLELLNNQSYTILFWANKKDAHYYDLGNLRNVVMKQCTSNNNDRDAFCGKDQITAVTTAAKRTVELTRPFAQVNIATLVKNAQFDIQPKSSLVKFTNVPTAYNVLTGDPLSSTEVTYTENTVPGGQFDGTEYVHAAMNYIFVPASVDGSSIIDHVYYEINTDNGKVFKTIDNVPVKKNYRTNIIGNLLTSGAEYTITVEPGFEEGPYYGPEFVQEPKFNAETKTYAITNALELKWVAQQVNTGKKSFKGETVQLAADIDLQNEPWTPIGISWQNAFKGTFEGVAITRSESTYPTISNVNIVGEKNIGFFGVATEGAIKNFNISNVKVVGKEYVGAVVGRATSPVSYVHVNNAELTALAYLMADGVTYDGGAKVGGIAGILDDSTAPHMLGNSVTNATIKGYRDLGGIVGSLSAQPCTIKNCKVEDLTFIVTSCYTPYDGNKASGSYGPILGGTRSFPGDVIEGNEGTDINDHKVLEEKTEGGVYDSEEKVYTVTSPAGLAAALQSSGAAGAGNHTIQINGNLDMTGVDWTPIYVDGYNGAGIVTVEGNHAIIKGLDGALFAGGFAGGSGIVIKDLTIEDAYMIADNTQGYGAFVNCADSMDEITLINCHLENSTIITPNDGAAESRIGGLVGWTAGYNKQNDGPVDSHITIQNCSVTGCTLKGAGSIGGICGHAGANAATFTTIEDCTVTGNILVSTDDGDWRVGAIVGTANNGKCEINNVIVSGNTISQVGKTAEVWQSEIYGRFVPDGTGTLLTIDGVTISATKPTLVNGYTALYDIDGNYYVYNKKGLEDLNLFFKNNALANHLWTRSYNIAADIDATGFTWNSVYVVVGSNANDGFVLNGCGHTISNLSINGSMFTGTPNGGNEGTKPGYVKDITIDRARVTGGFDAAVFWGQSYGELVYENVTVKNTSVTGDCNTAILLGRTYEDGKGIDNILFKNCKVEKCSVVANGCPGQDPTGASVFVGRAFGKTKLTFEGNSIDEATTITNKNGLVGDRVYAYTVLVDGKWEGTGACDTFTNWDGVSIAAKVGTTTYNTIQEAIAAATAGDTVKLLDDVKVSTLTLPEGIKFNGNGKQIEGTISAAGDLTLEGHTKVTSFSAGFSGNTITIEKGACLEVTGSGRSTFGYANTFDIKGELTDAKIADKTKIQPSLIIPAGLSVTGGNGFTLKVKDAYVQIGSTTSKPGVANGEFTLNFENSIAEFTDQLTFAEPTSGKNPTFNLNVKNSVLTTPTKLCIAAPNTNVVIDNSTVTLGTYLRNSGNLTLKNGSTLTGKTIQFGENGGNNGIINVDASTFTIVAGSTGHAFDGKGSGVINATNGAVVSVDYYKDMTINEDETSTFTGTEVQ